MESERVLFTHTVSSPQRGEEWMCEIQRCGNSLLWNSSSVVSAVSRNSLGVREDKVPARFHLLSSASLTSFYPCSSRLSTLPPLNASNGGNWLYLAFDRFDLRIVIVTYHAHRLEMKNKRLDDILLICVSVMRRDRGAVANRRCLKYTWLKRAERPVFGFLRWGRSGCCLWSLSALPELQTTHQTARGMSKVQ